MKRTTRGEEKMEKMERSVSHTPPYIRECARAVYLCVVGCVYNPRVSVHRPAESGKRRIVMGLTGAREKEQIDEPAHVSRETEDEEDKFDQEFWLTFVTGLPLYLARPFLPFAGIFPPMENEGALLPSSSAPDNSSGTAVGSDTSSAPALPVKSMEQVTSISPN